MTTPIIVAVVAMSIIALAFSGLLIPEPSTVLPPRTEPTTIKTPQPPTTTTAGQEFSAQLTGPAEVPPVETSATGQATFNLNEDGDAMSYDLTAEGLTGVLFAHIHQGNENENGPIVVTLFNASEPIDEIDGMLTNGDFTADDFEGPLQEKSMLDLVNLINSGNAYVNVHTETNPPGELRGTIA